jgi:sugar/nucleoside kinase (ribokinase family)
MKGDIACTLLSAGFTIVMNESEACMHANALTGYLNLKPFSNGGVDMDSLILAVEALQSKRKGAEAPIYVTMGKQGCMCADTDGTIYFGGTMRPEQEPVSTLGAGDAWAAGLVEGMFYNHKGIENTLRFATAVARAKIDGNLSSEYTGELLASEFPFGELPRSLESYASAIRSRRCGSSVLDLGKVLQNSESRQYRPFPCPLPQC